MINLEFYIIKMYIVRCTQDHVFFILVTLDAGMLLNALSNLIIIQNI